LRGFPAECAAGSSSIDAAKGALADLKRAVEQLLPFLAGCALKVNEGGLVGIWKMEDMNLLNLKQRPTFSLQAGGTL